MNIYKHSDYKAVLREKIRLNQLSYGYKSQLAKAAGCQKSFLSQVLNSHVHLTPEHALGIAIFWNLDPKQRDYFLELVNFARAGNEKLRELIRSRLDGIKIQVENLSKRFQQKGISKDNKAVIYYSAWYFSAIHMLVSIPTYQTVESISGRLQLPEGLIKKTLEILKDLNLVQKIDGRWESLNKSLHLSNESFLNGINHNNWRQKAVESALQNHPRHIHYTAIYSLSFKDLETLRQMMLEFIDHTRKIVGPSKEEDLVCFNCDFFRI